MTRRISRCGLYGLAFAVSWSFAESNDGRSESQRIDVELGVAPLQTSRTAESGNDVLTLRASWAGHNELAVVPLTTGDITYSLPEKRIIGSETIVSVGGGESRMATSPSVTVALTIIALGILIYTYVGYPVLIALAARLFPLRLQTQPRREPSVSALIATYNAASYVRCKLDSLIAQDYPAAKLEILVCSDASDDDTDKILQEYAQGHPCVRVFRSEIRRGKPSAINRMLDEATGEVLLMTDIRQPIARGAVRALVEVLSDERVGCVSGSLVSRGPAGAGFYWRYENWIRRSEASFRSMVGVTGPLYAIRRREMTQLPPDVVLDDMWVPMRLRLMNRVVAFEARAEAYEDAFEDRLEFIRKVRTLAGNYQLFARMPQLLLPLVNPSWFETFSHKLLRLAAPWLLAFLLVSSIIAVPAEPMLGGIAAAQVVFYCAAAVGPRGGRICAIARTFVVLNYAAFAGLARYLCGGQRVTW